MADRPAVRTVPNVELFRTGTWPASTGPVTWATDDLLSAKAAFDDPGYTRPVVKIGHVDPRFDGEPTLGRIANPRLSDDQQTFIGDLVGVPTWLADILEQTEAFPGRSIEGTFGLTTGTGTKHAFALTAVSLLGIAAPAVSSLADVASLYGMDPVEVAAAAADSLEGTVPGQTPTAVTVPGVRAATVSVDRVRQAWYGSDAADNLPPWSWIVDVRMGTDGDPSVVIVDDDEGSLWEIPFTVDATTEAVTFDMDAKQRKRVEYVDVPDQVAATATTHAPGALRARLAHMRDDQTTTPPDPTPVAASGSPETQEAVVEDTTLAGLRTLVGVPDDADEATTLAAVSEALTERADPAADAGGSTPPVPDGFTVVDNDTLETLRTAASRGVEAHQRFMRQDRDGLIAAAVADGRIARAAVQRWTDRWDAEAQRAGDDAPDTRETLASLPTGLVPVEPAGEGGQPIAATADGDSLYASLWGDDGSKAVIGNG